MGISPTGNGYIEGKELENFITQLEVARKGAGVVSKQRNRKILWILKFKYGIWQNQTHLAEAKIASVLFSPKTIWIKLTVQDHSVFKAESGIQQIYNCHSRAKLT